MNDPNPLTPHQIIMAAINAAAHVLSRRLLLLLGLFLDFFLFAWTAYAPDPWRLGAAVLFGVLVWVTVSYPKQ